MNNGNIFIYDTKSLIPEHKQCKKTKCNKEIDVNMLLTLSDNNVIIKKTPCKKTPSVKTPCNISDDECESDHISFTSASSFESFDSFDEDDCQLLEHEINRSRVLIKQNYNKNQH